MSVNERMEQYYLQALDFCKGQGFGREIDYVRNRTFEQVTEEGFESEYAYVVVNSGMRNQIAEEIFGKLCVDGISAVRHEGKREAIGFVMGNRKKLFDELIAAQDKLAFLDSLPWIGPITKYHLARNLGLDCVKPDRHLVRLAERYGFNSPAFMCEYLAMVFRERVGTIDVILWRYCNITGNYGLAVKE